MMSLFKRKIVCVITRGIHPYFLFRYFYTMLQLLCKSNYHAKYPKISNRRTSLDLYIALLFPTLRTHKVTLPIKRRNCSLNKELHYLTRHRHAATALTLGSLFLPFYFITRRAPLKFAPPLTAIAPCTTGHLERPTHQPQPIRALKRP